MERRITVEAFFAAATDRHEGERVHLHGHTYRVRATTVAESDPTLQAHLQAVAGELDLRRLEDMIVGGSTDLFGIASWFLERLIMAHQGIVEIEMTEDPFWRNATITVVRTLRSPVR